MDTSSASTIIDTASLSSSSSTSTLSLYDTFAASLQSVGTAATLAAAGFYLHRRGLLGMSSSSSSSSNMNTNETYIQEEASKFAFARYCQQVALPALFFTKMVQCSNGNSRNSYSSSFAMMTEDASLFCPSVLDHWREAWILLLWPLYVVFCGTCIGLLTHYYVKGRPTTNKKMRTLLHDNDFLQRRILLVLAVAFGNSTGLPTTLLGVLAENRVFHNNNTSSTSNNMVVDDPNLFLSVYLIVYPILQWGIGGWLLAPPPPTPPIVPILYAKDDDDDEEVQPPHDFCCISGKRRCCGCWKNHHQHHYHHASDDDDDSVDCNDNDNVEVSKEQQQHQTATRPLMIVSSHGHDYRRHHSQSSTSSLCLGRKPVTSHEEHCHDENHMQQCHDDDNNNNNNDEELQHLTLKSSEQIPESSTTSSSSSSTTAIRSPTPSSCTAYSTGTAGVSTNCTMTSISTAVAVVASATLSSRGGDAASSTCYYYKSSIQSVLNQVCGQPPVIGALLGLVVVSIPPLRHLFVPHLQQHQQQQQNQATTVADAATAYIIVKPVLGWFLDGLVHLGKSAIPMNMIVLGINLSCTMTLTPCQTSSSSSSSLDCQTILAAVVAKIIVMPLLGIASVAMLLHFTSISFPPAMTVVLMLVWITPTANNVMVMVDLASSRKSGSSSRHDDDDKYRQGMAQILAWQYALAPVLLSFWVTIVIRVAHW